MLKRNVRIICVLRRSAHFDVDYVTQLKRRVEYYAPGVPFVCISNIQVPCERIPMRKMWNSWWCKMELFAPWVEGDLFFMDLDTIPCGQFWDLLNVGELTMLDDFYKPERAASGLMYLPEDVRSDVWKLFVKNSIGYMQKFRRGGDQEFLGMCFGHKPLRWQKEFPDRVVSYKAHRLHQEGLPEKAAIICFHGRPKPRDVNWQVKGLPDVDNS